MLEDADGSLIVINTGGWYKLCCPTSQLWKPDILGAIYRVRRTGAPRIDDPRGLKVAWREASPQTLSDFLGDARPAVRKRAIQELAAQGERVVPVLQEVLKSPAAEARRNAVWTLTRIEGPNARQAVRAALDDPDETVRQTALHSISVWRDANARTRADCVAAKRNASQRAGGGGSAWAVSGTKRPFPRCWKHRDVWKPILPGTIAFWNIR